MADYVKLLEAWKRTENEDGSETGTKAYVFKSGGSEDLPSLSDPWDDVHTRLLARTLEVTLMGDKEGAETTKYAFQYSTQQPEDSDPGTAEEYPRSLDVSVEFLNIGGKKGETPFDYSGSGGGIEQDLFKRVVLSTITVTKVYDDFNELLDKLRQTVGQVNFQPIFGQPLACILLDGARATETRTSEGLKWPCQFTFLLRRPKLRLADAWGDWNHAWIDKEGDFKFIEPAPYESVDMENILGKLE